MFNGYRLSCLSFSFLNGKSHAIIGIEKNLVKKDTPLEKIWIIGVGQFGFLSYQRLSEKGADRHFVLVDPNAENLSRADGRNVTLENQDGVTFVEHRLSLENKPDWIIPALPIHLAAEWCLRKMGSETLYRTTLPPEIEPHLPNPLRGADGNIYVSHADFTCPDDCAEPRDFCTVTHNPRGRNMFEILGDITAPPFQPLVIRSHQLGPGIGGYRPEKLFELLNKVEQSRGDLLLCTACRCHGVVTGLKKI
jgi:hypothetical protein